MEETPFDLSPDSTPIDLTTLKRRSPDPDEHTPKRLKNPLYLFPDKQNISRQYSGEKDPSSLLYPLDISSNISPRSWLRAPAVLRKDTCEETGAAKMKRFPPMTSPSLCSSPILSELDCLNNATTSATGELPMASAIFPVPVKDLSTESGYSNKRYMSAARPFNILAKKLLSEIECPARPAKQENAKQEKPDSTSSPGNDNGEVTTEGTGPKEETQSGDAYREKRNKNNMAARRSRNNRKLKAEIIAETFKDCQGKGLAGIDRIEDTMKGMRDDGFKGSLSYDEELASLREELLQMDRD